MELLEMTNKLLDEKLAEHIVDIDMRGASIFTDWFVVCTARNVRHGNALAEALEQEASKQGFNVRLREGEKESTWILVDMEEVIVHIFTEEARSMFRLEKLWADLPQEAYPSEGTAL